MEKLLELDSPSAIGDVNFCNIEVNPFQSSSISPSISISPTTHDIPVDNAFFLPNNHLHVSSMAHIDDIASPPPFWDHSMPPQCGMPKRNNNDNDNNQVISPAEIIPMANPLPCNFRSRDPPEIEAKPPANANTNVNMNMNNMESIQGAGDAEKEYDVQFTPDFGSPFPALHMTNAKAMTRYTFDMNVPSLVFVPPLSTLSGSLSCTMLMPASSRTSAGRYFVSSVGIRKGKVAGGARLPSKFCHICLRRGERIELLACTGVRCRKVTCEKCFIDFGWDYTYAKTDPDWTCCHCRGICPERAQCFIYRRTNNRRHQQLVAKKQKSKRSILLE